MKIVNTNFSDHFDSYVHWNVTSLSPVNLWVLLEAVLPFCFLFYHTYSVLELWQRTLEHSALDAVVWYLFMERSEWLVA